MDDESLLKKMLLIDMKYSIGFNISMNGLDFLTTYIALEGFPDGMFTEKNPLAKYVFDEYGVLFGGLALKCWILSMFYFLNWKCYSYYKKEGKEKFGVMSVNAFNLIGGCFVSFFVISNSYLLIKGLEYLN